MTRQRNESGYNEAVISFRTSSPIVKAVIRYLHGKTDSKISGREGKSRGVDAMLSFWKPYAVKAQRRHQKVASSPEDLQQIARDCIEELLRHAQRIADDFDLNLSLSYSSQPNPPAPPPAPPTNLTLTESPPSKKETLSRAWWIAPLAVPSHADPLIEDLPLGGKR